VKGSTPQQAHLAALPRSRNHTPPPTSRPQGKPLQHQANQTAQWGGHAHTSLLEKKNRWRRRAPHQVCGCFAGVLYE
jgi:hypothetical protein